MYDSVRKTTGWETIRGLMDNWGKIGRVTNIQIVFMFTITMITPLCTGGIARMGERRKEIMSKSFIALPGCYNDKEESKSQLRRFRLVFLPVPRISNVTVRLVERSRSKWRDGGCGCLYVCTEVHKSNFLGSPIDKMLLMERFGTYFVHGILIVITFPSLLSVCVISAMLIPCENR